MFQHRFYPNTPLVPDRNPNGFTFQARCCVCQEGGSLALGKVRFVRGRRRFTCRRCSMAKHASAGN